VKFRAIQGEILSQESEAIVLYIGEDDILSHEFIYEANNNLENCLSDMASQGQLTGKKGELTLIHTLGHINPKRLLIVGLGKESDLSLDVIRNASAQFARRLRSIGIQRAHTIVPQANMNQIQPSQIAVAITEGALLGLYNFRKHTGKADADGSKLDEIVFVDKPSDRLETFSESIRIGTINAEATILARDMVNQPANFMTPSIMAQIASDIAKSNTLDLEIFSSSDLSKLKMGGLLGVAKGTLEPPKFIIIKYSGDPDNPSNNIGILGKGITFDTGGISLKSAAGMVEMKGDMAGAAAAIASMQAIGKLRPKINVICMVAATENMPSGSAQKPGDVLTTFSGKTVEVDNTDAEGRLVLADALGYASALGLNRVIDIATLTGAIITSLGDVYTGGFTNDQEFWSQLMESSVRTGEKFWLMPMHEDYKRQNISDVADIKNSGGRKAGSITAAHFLAEFVEDMKWIHLDIAGTSTSDRLTGYTIKGATGCPTRTIVQLICSLGNDS
tara:strand:- start:11178 stop:12689 length:1512 start_codon:yes stop_codon:yes gene_type:complete